MKILLLLIITTLAISVSCRDLFTGDFGQGAELVHNATIKYNPILLKSREKFYFYSQPDNRKIRGIQVFDNVRANNNIEITAGGVGYSFVNFRLNSQRSKRMEYRFQIYVDPVYYTGSQYNQN